MTLMNDFRILVTIQDEELRHSSNVFRELNLNGRQKEEGAKSRKRNCHYDVYLNTRKFTLQNNSSITSKI